MRKINDHVKEALDIKPKPKVKKDYTKAFVWFTLGAVTVIVWALIYNLIF
jgi:hypothetical protein